MTKKELQIEIQANTKKLDELITKLSETEKKSKKVQESFGESVKNMLSGAVGKLGAIFALDKIKDFAVTAVREFANVDRALRNLKAEAVRSGNPFEELKSGATALSRDGILSLENSAKAMGNLSRAGLNAKKSLDFAESLKKLTTVSFGAGEAQEMFLDITKDIAKGEFQAVEKLGKDFKVYIDQLGGSEAIMTDFQKQQKLINMVIDEGSKVANEYTDSIEGMGSQLDRLENSWGKFLTSTGQMLASSSLVSGIRSLLDDLGSIFDFIANSETYQTNFETMIADIKRLQELPEGAAETEELTRKILSTFETLPQKWKDELPAWLEQEGLELPIQLEDKSLDELREELARLKEEFEVMQVDVGANPAELERYQGLIDSLQSRIDQMETQAGRQSTGTGRGGGGFSVAQRSDFMLTELQKELQGIQSAFDAYKASVKNDPDLVFDAQFKANELATQAFSRYLSALENSVDSEYFLALNAIREEKEAKLKSIEAERKAGVLFDDQAERLSAKVEQKALIDSFTATANATQKLTESLFGLEQAIVSGSFGGILSGIGGVTQAAGGIAGSAAVGAIGLGIGVVGSIVSGISGIIQREEEIQKSKRQARQREIEAHETKLVKLAERNAEIYRAIYDLEKKRLDLIRSAYDRQAELVSLSGKKQTEIIEEQIAILRKQFKAEGGGNLTLRNAERQAENLNLQVTRLEKQQAFLSTLSEILKSSKTDRTKLDNFIQANQFQIRDIMAGTNEGLKNALKEMGIAENMQSVWTNVLTGETQLNDPTPLNGGGAVDGAFVQTQTGTGTFSLGALGDKVDQARLQEFLTRVLGGLENTLDSAQGQFESATEFIKLNQELETLRFSERQEDIERLLSGMEAVGFSQAEINAEAIKNYQQLANQIQKQLGVSDLSQLPTIAEGLAGADLENYNLLIGILDKIKIASELTAENTASLNQVDERNISFLDYGRGMTDRGISSRLNLNLEALQLTSGVSNLSVGSISESISELDQLVKIVSQMERSINIENSMDSKLGGILSVLQKSSGIISQTQAMNNAKSRSF
jgi:hypothetical protein